MLLARRTEAERPPVAGLHDTLSWLRKKSGAVQRRNVWPTRAARARSKVGISRVEIERGELQRWRVVLDELVLEAKLPHRQGCFCF